MIRHEATIHQITPLGVTKQMRDAAANRKGEWEVITYDWDIEHPDDGCWGRLFGLGMARLCGYKEGGRTLQRTRIVLQEKEIPRILHIFTHGYRNKTKIESIHANLEQCAETMWPSGSLEHVAMRFLAVPILCRVFAGHRLKMTKFHERFVCCMGAFVPVKCHLKTQMQRRDDQSSGALNHSGGEPGPDSAQSTSAEGKKDGKPPPDTPKGPASSGASPGTSPPVGHPPGGVPASQSPGGSGPDAPDVPPTSLGRVSPKHGGCTPEDADIIANEIERIFEKAGIKMIVGQDYGDENGKDLDNKQIVGVMTTPTPKKPNVYNKSSRNAKAAKRKRLDEKARPYTGTKADQKKIKKFIGEACGYKKNRAIFSIKRIQEWAEKNLHLDKIKSGKWSDKRLSDSLANLMAKAFPEFNLKCDVKLEPMPEGKAPRLLIADGDDGQLMALIVVKCFEDLLFEWFESKSIKHAGKRVAIQRVIKVLKKEGAKLIEGDGSAWDTTCNSTTRGQVENPVLKHIMQQLIPYGVVPQQWHEEHMKCNDAKKLKLFFEKKLDKMRMTIDAIRRSGHRGTSCLNWWENFTHWSCSIFKEPERFLDPTVRKGLDVTGRTRWWMGAFEGDDSLCALYPPMKPGDDLDKEFIGWWERQGFNMKIVYATNRATFCGYHIACNEGEPTGFACPELPRALVGAGVSTSATIIKAAKEGDINTVKDIAAAGALARAADFAGIFPTVSRKFHDYAKSIKRSSEIVDREMSMRVAGEEGHNFTEIEATIESQNLQVTPTEELANLAAVGCQATMKELDTFMVHEWTFEGIGDYDTHRASLPVSWRPEDD